MTILKVIIEGLGLGAFLYIVCAVGIRNGAVGMVHLYSDSVQKRVVELGLNTPEEIKKRSILFKTVCIPGYLVYVLVCVYAINVVRGFLEGFWQMLVILSIRWLQELQNKTKTKKVIVGREPTGCYWLTFQKFLKNHGIQLVTVNPYSVKKCKELDDNSPEKSDLKDPKTIAGLVREGRFSTSYLPAGVYLGG